MGESVISLSQFKATASQLLTELERSHRPIILTQNGAASAVVQDLESYNKTKDALVMLKLLAQGEADIQHGRFVEQHTFFENVKQRLKSVDD